MAGLADLGFHGLQAADLAKLLPSDEMEPAINIMAEVRAYFQGNIFPCFGQDFVSNVIHQKIREVTIMLDNANMYILTVDHVLSDQDKT
jgi:hypothetical protein